MTSRWYVLTCKPNKEEIVYRQLQSQGYEVFYPRFFSTDGKSGRLSLRSYFPGYMFVRLDLDKIGMSAFQWMPNTGGLVCFGMKPAFVPDALIEAIRRHVSNLNVPFRSSDMEDQRIMEKGAQHFDRGSEYHLFDSNLTSHERVDELLRVLQGLSVLTDGDKGAHN